MSTKQWLPLIALVICVFIVNMSEFVPIGLLTDIATDFDTSESTAGLLISIYAWAVAILSLPIMLALRKMEFRRMLLMCIALFVVFQIMSGISSSYWMLMVSRIGVAVAHSIFWSIATPMAVRIVPAHLQKLAISSVATGTSVAMIVGLPLGRVIGLALGWRMTFIVIAAVSILALILLVLVFPKLDNPGTFTLKKLPDLFRNKVLVGIYIMLAIYVTGYYTGYSYIEPFMYQVAGMSDTMVTVVLTVFGLAGIVGSILFTKFYDRTRFRFMIAALLGAAVCLLLLRPSVVSLATVLLVCALWGLFATSYIHVPVLRDLQRRDRDGIHNRRVGHRRTRGGGYRIYRRGVRDRRLRHHRGVHHPEDEGAREPQAPGAIASEQSLNTIHPCTDMCSA